MTNEDKAKKWLETRKGKGDYYSMGALDFAEHLDSLEKEKQLRVDPLSACQHLLLCDKPHSNRTPPQPQPESCKGCAQTTGMMGISTAVLHTCGQADTFTTQEKPCEHKASNGISDGQGTIINRECADCHAKLPNVPVVPPPLPEKRKPVEWTEINAGDYELLQRCIDAFNTNLISIGRLLEEINEKMK